RGRRRPDREDLPRSQARGARGGGSGGAGVTGGALLAHGIGRRRAHLRCAGSALRAATAAVGGGDRLAALRLAGVDGPGPRVAPLGAGRAFPAERPSAAVSGGAAGRPGGAPLSERGAATGWGGRRTRRRRGGSEFGAAPSGRPSRAGANAVAAARPRSGERPARLHGEHPGRSRGPGHRSIRASGNAPAAPPHAALASAPPARPRLTRPATDPARRPPPAPPTPPPH